MEKGENVQGMYTYYDTSRGVWHANDFEIASDRRLKSNIKPLNNRGFIEPKTYIKDGVECIGFIAQDVKELYPECVSGEEKEDQYLSIKYPQMIAILESQIIEQS